MIAYSVDRTAKPSICFAARVLVVLLSLTIAAPVAQAQNPLSDFLKKAIEGVTKRQPSQTQQSRQTSEWQPPEERVEDMPYIQRALDFALETTRSGTQTTWEDPATGHHGVIVPSPAFKSATGQDCRGFERTVVVGAAVTKYEGTACRQATAVWNIRDERLVAPTSVAGTAEPWREPIAGADQPTPEQSKNITAETQRLLNELGYDAGPADGIFGPKTKAAIEDFQREQAVYPDGEVSETLLTRLQEAASRSASGITKQQQEAKQALINALEELDWAVTAKINYDVETTARAFSDAYDIERSRRIADFVLAPLTVIEQAIGLLASIKSAPDIVARLDQAENVLQVASVFMAIGQLQKVGENLQLALDGPTYSSLAEAMLEEAAGASDPADYTAVVKLNLDGVGGRRSPIGVRRLTSQASSGLVWGARAVKREISAQVARLVTELSGKDVAGSRDAIVARLSETTRAIKRSRLGNVAVSALVPAEGIELGSIGALEKIRRYALDAYDKNLRMEQSAVITSAIKAGAQAVTLSVVYDTPTGQLIGKAEREVFTPISVYQTTVSRIYDTNARQQVNGLPHEMLLTLSAELSNTWRAVDETLTYVRTVIQAPAVATVEDQRKATQPLVASQTDAQPSAPSSGPSPSAPPCLSGVCIGSTLVPNKIPWIPVDDYDKGVVQNWKKVYEFFGSYLVGLTEREIRILARYFYRRYSDIIKKPETISGLSANVDGEALALLSKVSAFCFPVRFRALFRSSSGHLTKVFLAALPDATGRKHRLEVIRISREYKDIPAYTIGDWEDKVLTRFPNAYSLDKFPFVEFDRETASRQKYVVGYETSSDAWLYLQKYDPPFIYTNLDFLRNQEIGYILGDDVGITLSKHPACPTRAGMSVD